MDSGISPVAGVPPNAAAARMFWPDVTRMGVKVGRSLRPAGFGGVRAQPWCRPCGGVAGVSGLPGLLQLCHIVKDYPYETGRVCAQKILSLSIFTRTALFLLKQYA